MAELDRDRTYKDFHTAVNMAAAELERWLMTPESRDVGFKGSDGDRHESVGHASGRRIIAILGKKASALTDADYQHMQKVVGYVHRHLAQEPADREHSPWRYSLMNWGHDPLKGD